MGRGGGASRYIYKHGECEVSGLSETYFQEGITKLTPWSRGLFEKLTVSQLVKKFSAFYGTRRFMTAFTRARHLSLS
jgi:hypothetical protein